MQQPTALVAAFVHAYLVGTLWSLTSEASGLLDASDVFMSAISGDRFECHESVSNTPISDLLAPLGCPALEA